MHVHRALCILVYHGTSWYTSLSVLEYRCIALYRFVYLCISLNISIYIYREWEKYIIICICCLVYRCISFYVLVYPCISLILCIYIYLYLIICIALCILPNPRISLYILRYIRVSLTMSFKTLSLPGRFPLIVSFESKTTNPPKRYSYIAAWILSILVAADLIGANKIGKISCQAALKEYTVHCRQPRYLQIVSGVHSPSKSQSKSINQFGNTNLMSLSIIVHHCLVFIPLHSYVKDSFLPIGTLLAKGKPPALRNFATSSEVVALEPSRGILSGSSDRVSEAIGLTREGL